MEIGDSTTRKAAPKMSAFPVHYRPFTEPTSATSDKIVGEGKTLPDLIRIYYPGTVPSVLQGSFAFLDRDNKERHYDPAKEDPFVFKSPKSIQEFSQHAHSLMATLCKLWINIGFDVIRDEDRGLDVPDSHQAWEALDPKHPKHAVLLHNRDAMMFIIANADIVKKSCVVRTVNPGWWAVSYKGKYSTDKAYFQSSLNAHRKAYGIISRSEKFLKIMAQLKDEASDPIDTNPGYPFFSASMDEAGNPTTRIKTVELFKGVFTQCKYNWDELLRLVDNRAGKYGMAGYPLTVGPLRRQQPGYKYQHQFRVTPSGMVTAFDERGVNSQRVAWMVPYVYNLFLTPLQLRMKAFRMILPGLYHDGPSKVERQKTLIRQGKNKKLFIAEADYSNYDRFIPVDIIDDIVSMITDELSHSDFWKKAAMHLHYDASLVWPDYSTISDGNGWLFKPGLLGLMSGVKVTSETGTLVNSVINAAVLAKVKGWSETQLVDYLCQYVNSTIGTKTEHFYVQSDDTLLIADTPLELKALGDEFMKAVKAAGLKGAVEFGDRFLMRHMQNGFDRPVPARVWQNTLSNESPPENNLIFDAGTGARTDGLFGIKTVDPFMTGKHQSITEAERIFTLEVVRSLNHFLSTSRLPQKPSLNILTSLINLNRVAEDYTKPGKTVKVQSEGLLDLNEQRFSIVRSLAAHELAKLNAAAVSKEAFGKSWLYSLFKDRNIPSQAYLLEQLEAMDRSIAPSLNHVAAREHAFFMYAINTIGVKLDI